MVLVMGFATLAADAEVLRDGSTSAGSAGALFETGAGDVDAGLAEEEAKIAPPAEELARRFGVRKRLAGIIYDEAQRAGIDPGMAFGVIAEESGFDPSAVGRTGELGLMQIKPSTARAHHAGITRHALLRPDVNVRLGLRHLKQEVEYFDDPILGLMSYRMGRARLEGELASGGPPLDRYVERVLSSCGSACA